VTLYFVYITYGKEKAAEFLSRQIRGLNVRCHYILSVVLYSHYTMMSVMSVTVFVVYKQGISYFIFIYEIWTINVVWHLKGTSTTVI